MRNLAVAGLLALLLVGCDNSFEDTPKGLTAPSNERRVSFQFDLLSRASDLKSTKKIPVIATAIRFVGRDSELRVVLDVTEAKDDTFVLRSKKKMSQVEVQVLAGEVCILSNVFQLPNKEEVQFVSPLLKPVAFQGGTGITIDPPSVQLAPEGAVSFQSFLTSGSERLNVTAFTKLLSSEPEIVSFTDEERPNTALALQAGEAQVTGLFGIPRGEVWVGRVTGAPQVNLVDLTNSQNGALDSFFSFGPEFSRGVRVATDDFNADGVPDLVAGTSSGVTRVRVINGATLAILHDIRPFGPDFQGGVRVATGDVTGDGIPDVIVGAGPGGAPLVKVFDGKTGSATHETMVFDQSFIGGVNVAAGDFNLDGRDDIVVGAGTGGPTTVRVFDGASGSQFKEFVASQQQFVGGIRVAVGDVNGDGADDIVTGTGPGSSPEVRVFDGRSTNPIGDFFAYQPGFIGGVHVSTADLNNDGAAEILTGGGSEASVPVRVFTGLEGEVLAETYVFGEDFKGGVCVAGVKKVRPRKSFRAQSLITVLDIPGAAASPGR